MENRIACLCARRWRCRGPCNLLTLYAGGWEEFGWLPFRLRRRRQGACSLLATTVITTCWTHTMAQLFVQAALEASHGAGRATLSSVATQALNAQHGEPSAASAAAPKGEIVKGAIGPTAAASPRASRYDGGSIQDRQSMFGGARRASLSATSVLGCAAAPPAAAAFAACAPVSETDVVDEQGVTQNALRKTSGRGLKSRGGASSPKAAKPSRPSARKIHRACGNVVPEAL